MKSLKNNLFLILQILLLVVLISCKSSYQINYDNSIYKDEYDTELSESLYPWSICIILENSMNDNKLFIQDFNSKEIIFDGKLDKSINSNVSKVIFVRNNPNNFDLKINDKLIHIDGYIYEKYRYLVIKKKGSKFSLNYVNEYPNYSFTQLCKLAKK